MAITNKLKYLNPFYQLRITYDWLIKWAGHKHATKMLAFVAFVEASFFLIPPEALFLPMATAEPKKSLRFALITSIFSVLGGIFGYYIGMAMWDLLAPFFFEHIFTEEKFAMVQGLFHEHGFITIFFAGITPIPFKIFTIVAGVVSLNFGVFVLGAGISRTLRYFIIGILLYVYGEKVRGLIEKHFEKCTIIGSILLIALFYLIKQVMH